MIANEVPVSTIQNQALTDRRAWQIWMSALKASKYGSLSVASEWMYKLNVLARSMGHVYYEDRHPIVDEIYALKDDLIKYLYQCGYATEVRESIQERKCRTCGGSGEYWTGEECYRCYGTGVYAVTKLYAFRFCIDGKPYAWHQLQKLVDYPVTLTDEITEPFRKPLTKIDDEYLKLEDAWLGVCCVWWALLLHGTVTDLVMFRKWRWSVEVKINKLKRWLTQWTWEKVAYTIVILLWIALVLGFVFYREVLTWIWCNIFQRCFEGVPF